MSFSNKSQSTPDIPISKLKVAKEKSLKATLYIIGRDIERGEEQLKTYKNLERNIEELKKKELLLAGGKNLLIAELRELENEANDQKNHIASRRKEVLDLGLSKKDLDVAKTAKDHELEDLDIRISEAKISITSLEEKVKQTSDTYDRNMENIRSAEKELEVKRLELGAIVKKKDTQIVELDFRIKGFEEKRISLKMEEENLTIRITDLESEVSLLLRNRAELDADITKRTEVLIEKESAFELKTLEQKTEIEGREGAISDKEALLKEKEETLRKTKKELEKHFNRKLNSVII